MCRGGEGSGKSGRASFLRRGNRSSASAGSKAAPSQSKTSDVKASQLQSGQPLPEPLPLSGSPAQPTKRADAAHQQQRRHTEGSQAEAGHALGMGSSSTQTCGRSGSFSAASMQALHADEQKLQLTPGSTGSMGLSSSAHAGNQREGFFANGESQAPRGQWCASSPSHVHQYCARSPCSAAGIWAAPVRSLDIPKAVTPEPFSCILSRPL